MGEKDIAEKTLESYNDVFADIINVLLFNGKRMVKEKDLIDDTPISIIKADEKLHTQERDIAKFWKNCNVRIALYGIENQTSKDNKMPARIIAYDGASYKQQLIKKKGINKQKKLYPVVSIVLYFGMRHWKKPRRLLETVDVPEYLTPYVNDYKINLFEIAYLSDEQVNMFKSDFKIVADYFVQKRKNKNYIPSKQVMKHVKEVLELLRILTGDKEYEISKKLTDLKGETITMDTWLSDTLTKERNNAEKKGEKKGKLEALLALVNDGILTLAQVASRMGMSIKKLKKESEALDLKYNFD